MTESPLPSCLACGSQRNRLWGSSTDREYHTTDERFSYYRCLDCGVLFIDPVPADRLATIYPTNYYSFKPTSGNFTVRAKEWLDRRNFRKILRRLPGHQIDVLDVGGGTGWLLDQLRSIDRRIRYTQVVDLDPDAAVIARRAGHDYHCGRVEDFTTDRRFDLILMLNLVEHVADPMRVLSKLEGCLSETGRIYLKTPNVDCLDARLFRPSDWGALHCPRHWVLFSRPCFERLLPPTRLRIASSQYTQGASFWAFSVLFLLERWGLVRISRERPAAYHPLYPWLSAAFALIDFVRMPFSKPAQMFLVLERA
jgi:SAM-dependent methyltransferase